MKHLYSIPLSLGLLFLTGCEMRRKTGKPEVKNKKEMVHDQVAAVDIPMSEDVVRSFFDEEIGEFAVLDDTKAEVPATEKMSVASNDVVVPEEYADEFAWIEDDDLNRDFNVVYYDFDKSNLREDQEDVISDNVARLVHEVEMARQEGKEPLIVIEGHACSITRSRVYNLAISEKRAKVLADKLVEAGVPQENIKVVGRGEEYPAIIDGKQVSGSKEEQWPNRRAETHLIYA